VPLLRPFLSAFLLFVSSVPCLGAGQGGPNLGGGGEVGERTVLPTEARQAMLLRHNEWRLHAGVLPLAWSDEMARAAGHWALQLERGRGQPCDAQPSTDPYIGENMYWSSAYRWKDGRTAMQPLDPAYVVDQWAQQVDDLDPETGRCRPGRICSHYQQLVEPSAREVGCARLVCPALDQVWICQYRLG
jgi:pathogenesis-related protein 1